jgi:hypothetical protein
MADQISHQLGQLIAACARAIIKLDYVWMNAQNQLKIGANIGGDDLYHVLANVMDIAITEINFKLDDIPEKPTNWSFNPDLKTAYIRHIYYYCSAELRKQVKKELKTNPKPLKQQLLPACAGGTLDKREIDKRFAAFRQQLPDQFQEQFQYFVDDLTKYLQQK